MLRCPETNDDHPFARDTQGFARDPQEVELEIELLSQEQKDALRTRRNQGVRWLRTLGLMISGCSLVAMVIGIACIVVQIIGPPYTIGLALLSGILGILSGLVAILGARKGRSESHKETSDISSSLEYYWTGLFYACAFELVASFLVALFEGLLGVIFCVSEHSDKNNMRPLCRNNYDTNLALSVLTLIICLVLVVLNFMGARLSWQYRRSFGYKSMNEYVTELQLLQMQVPIQAHQMLLLQQELQMQRGGQQCGEQYPLQSLQKYQETPDY